MKVRLYLDEDVDETLALALGQRGFDALTTQEAGNLHARDDDQLAFATETGRAFFTHNRGVAAISLASNRRGYGTDDLTRESSCLTSFRSVCSSADFRGCAFTSPRKT